MGSIKSISDLLITKNILINENNQNNSDIEDLNKKLINKKINLSMSVETFLVSLEITFNSIKRDPLGLGFNRYQIAHERYINKIVKINPNIKKNNIFDGSTNLSKLSTEFGFFGIFLILFFVYTLYKNKNLDHFDYFIISLITVQFLRGVGYFNAGFSMMLLVYFYKYFSDANKT